MDGRIPHFNLNAVLIGECVFLGGRGGDVFIIQR